MEAQHRVSTLKLVDTLAEQVLLEELLETAKPAVPEPCAHLDYLLSTPFRYAPYPYGSRFRRAGFTEGVFYAAERVETALAEMAFYRLLFYAESPETPWPANPAEYTAFAVALATKTTLDLTKGSLSRDAVAWTNLTDYAACQALADAAREAGTWIILYRSVRDPEAGKNIAVLNCAAFSEPKAVERQSWRIHLSPSGVRALRDFPERGLDFSREIFVSDPRLADIRWER
ncbi:hypothetical protein GCM10010136_20850 [Limoniibacter endophyticus]|uniref:RES domain-containing protein n=1 Tax=Limoniibacter endophyticus TaxID=1565040 RepID=A0A8J3GIL1_9HYPH|nr:hypothetical protein GCM10010136_20850 [Limoniibacter endophyticus]